MMLGIRSGTWSFSSKKDPRWNCSGRTEYMSVWFMPDEAEKKLKELKKEYGEQPDDLTYSCMKD